MKIELYWLWNNQWYSAMLKFKTRKSAKGFAKILNTRKNDRFRLIVDNGRNKWREYFTV